MEPENHNFKPDVESVLQRIKADGRAARKKAIRKERITTATVFMTAAVIIGVISYISIDLYNTDSDRAPVIAFTSPDADDSYLTLSDGSIILLDEELVPQELYAGDSGNKKNGGEEDKIEEVKYHELTVARKNFRVLTLPDGSKITVNSASTLIFPDKFGEDERRVKLNGEAYLEILSDSLRPFIIETHNCQAVVLGTVLNISAYENETSTEVTLVSGKVTVHSMSSSQTVMLSPGQQAVVTADNVFTKIVDTDHYTSWRNGIFRFYNSTLNDITRQIARWYDIDLMIENENAGNIRFSGVMQRNSPHEEILRRIEKTSDVKFTKTDEGYVIK